MARRSTLSPARASFAPPSDPATYSDLLLFENRLKGNALSLNRRKSRYQFFLAQLILTICFLLSEVLLQTSFLVIPYKLLLCYVFPEVYPTTLDVDVQLHPYFTSGLLFVAITTLVLFFATGVYSEKIGYANRYVPHANRALRSFNMFLNMRTAPRSSSFNPLSYLFARPPLPPSVSPSRPSSRSPTPVGNSPTLPRRRTPSPSPLPSRRTPTPLRFHHTTDQSSSINPVTSNIGTTNIPALPIPTIPPTTNPRGEIIFSSRVDRGFRDGYTKYRAAFERRREQKDREAWEKTWIGWVGSARAWPWNWRTIRAGSERNVESGEKGGGSVPVSRAGSMREKGEMGVGASPSRTSSTRGRGPRTGVDNTTPTSSRRSTPAPPTPASSVPPVHQAHASAAVGRPPPMYL